MSEEGSLKGPCLLCETFVLLSTFRAASVEMARLRRSDDFGRLGTAAESDRFFDVIGTSTTMCEVDIEGVD